MKSARTAVLAIYATTALPALAVGFGVPAGNPVLGQPLQLEIPLTGHSGPLPAASCFRLTPAPGSSDELYFPRAYRIQAELRQGRPVVVIAANTVSQPVVEFRLSIECDTHFARDFTLLTALPEAGHRTTSQPPAPSAPALPAVGTPKPATTTAPATSGQHPATLETLARQKYPLQPKAREKFKRMMRAANPGLFSSRDDYDQEPLPADAVLTTPPGLPERRIGPATVRPPARSAARTTEPRPTTPAPAPTGMTQTDRLTVGTSPANAAPLTAAETDETLTRLEAMHAEQGKTQQEMVDQIAATEAAFRDLKDYILKMEERVDQLERERIEREKARELAQMLQLAAAVLFGGLLGAGLLQGYTRLARRKADTRDPDTPVAPLRKATMTATTPAAIPSVFDSLHAGPTTVSTLQTDASKPTREDGAVSPAIVSAPIPEAHEFDFMSWKNDDKAAEQATASPATVTPGERTGRPG